MTPEIQHKVLSFFDKYPTTTYSKGDIIIFAEQEPRGVLLLIDGIVEKFDIDTNGSKIVVNLYRPLSFFPMSWAINRTTNKFFYSAASEVTVRMGDPAEVVVFLKENPDVMLDLLSRVYKGTDGLLKRFSLAASGATINRLLLELLIEGYRFGLKLGDEKVQIKISQSTLSSRTGLARETISRELRALQAGNLINRTKDGIVIDAKQFESRLNMS
jgi:CRP-like cAMP-binding protein